MERDVNSEDVSFPDNSEYSTQFFNFTPRSFVDAIYNGLSEHVQDGLIEFYSKLRKIHPDGKLLNLTKPEIVDKVRGVFDKHFDKLELYLRSNITQIPKNVLLPEDYVHREFLVSNEDVVKEQEEIDKLKKNLLEAYHFGKLLEEESKEIDKTINSLTNLHSEMKQILNKFQDEATIDILREFNSQVAKDRQILSEIPLMISSDDGGDLNESE